MATCLPGMAAAHEMEAELQLATGLALIWLSIMGGILFAIMKESLRTVILFSLTVGLLVTFVVITPIKETTYLTPASPPNLAEPQEDRP